MIPVLPADLAAVEDRSTERVLVVKGISGLGDRILCLLTGVLYARLANRRLVVDWSDDAYAAGGTNAFHELFLTPLCAPDEPVPLTGPVTPALWSGRLHESAATLRAEFGALSQADGWRRFSIELSRLDYPEQVAVLWTYGAELEPLLPHLAPSPGGVAPTPAELLRSLLRESLSLHPDLQAQVERFRSAHFRGRMVGVHVRYSDHRSALVRTLRAVRQLTEQHPACGIFLCTDNVQVRRLFERRFPRVLSTDHWYAPVAGRPLHAGRRGVDPLQSGREALIDMYLLAACDHLVLDSSSNFAVVAALLSAASGAAITDVRRKGKVPAHRRHLVNELLRRLRVLSWGPLLLGQLVPRRSAGAVLRSSRAALTAWFAS